MKKAKVSTRDAGVVRKPITCPTPAVVGPLFRKVDWWTMGWTVSVMGLVYFLTLAPEVTLEDSGELVTGSYYAGIPHPPGYPVGTIYSWLWTVLVPLGNIAWRVALAEAAAGAISCGLLALMVSRGSGLFIEGIESFRGLTSRWENAICSICGVVAGLLFGLDAFMWRESVAANRIAVSSVPWLMLVLLCLLRWVYAPQQHRFLYWALFLFGICFTAHQSLIVAAIGIEVLILARNSKLGRDVFLGNGVIYTIYNLALLCTGEDLIHNIGAKPGLRLIFNTVGLGSLLISVWLMLKTKRLLTEWKPVVIMGSLWLLGASFYFYLPISCMTNPPMQWCYPRTVDGFFHALSRGQYEQPNPTNVLSEPGRFVGQLSMLIGGLADSFTWVCLLAAVVPFIFIMKMQKREQAWLAGIAAIYLCLGVLLIILLNPTPERASADLVKVFFNASHTLIAALVGYGLALMSAYMAVHYQKFRRRGLIAGIVASVLTLFNLVDCTSRHYFGPAGRVSLSDLPYWVKQAFAPHQYGLPIFAGLLLVLLALSFLGVLIAHRQRAPLALSLGIFATIPFYSGLAHWFECDQRGHMFGYWYGHDMFSPPGTEADGQRLFPEMTRDAVLFGGTDPGRFCPTYMIFCESFTPHQHQPLEDQTFDRRDVYLITQNALADPPYLNYIRAQYNRRAQIDPPFFSELLRMALRDKDYETNVLARMVAPLDNVLASWGKRVEARRCTATSWFGPKDFCDLSSLADKLRPNEDCEPVSKYVYESLSVHTQQFLSAQSEEPLLRASLANDLNRLLETQLYDPLRFAKVQRSESLAQFIAQNPQGKARVRLNRLLLESAYPHEIAHSRSGLYPDQEIYTPSAEDSQQCFQVYMQDLERRRQLGQLKPGEEVKIVDNRIQVSGTGAIMGINALIAKKIFDKNPQHEFFVEESVPLDWMYPHLTPAGIIMKVNRQPLSDLNEDVLLKDHNFWRQYSRRLTGDFVNDNTSTEELTDWIERVYLRRNFNGFTGNRKFIHDQDAQKAFSKLRCAVGGMYAWRLSPQCPPQYRPKSAYEFQRLLREADFAFRQAFAFCPYNPEAVFRYANLLLVSNRVEDAVRVAQVYLKLDPYSLQAQGLMQSLQAIQAQQRPGAKA